MSCDAWGNLVRVNNGFVNYRNRSIDILAVNVIQAKGKRVFINHYRENNDLPKMLIMCSSANNATRLYEYLIEELRESEAITSHYQLPSELSSLIHRMNTYFFNFLPSPNVPNVWSVLGCSRR